MRWFRPRAPKNPVGQVLKVDGKEFGVVDLGSAWSRDVRALINKNILTDGEPFRSGGVVGTACLPVLGTASTAASSLLAGNVFLASANPATLMTIGGGVGSAVIGTGGLITKQAPFIAASTAILPIVAPVMFFMTVSSMVMSVRFDRLERSLDRLAKAIEELLKRDLAADFGQVLGAIERLQDISAEFNESRRFTDEMKVRLALVERDVVTIRHKYDILIRQPLSASGAEPNLDAAAVGQHLYALSGIASLYVDRQRLRLALQDNPDDVKRSTASLTTSVQQIGRRLGDLLENSPLVVYRAELEVSLNAMNRFSPNVLKRRALESAKEHATEMRNEEIERVRKAKKTWSDAVAETDDEAPMSVIYYREDDGKGDLKAYYTGDLCLEEWPREES